MSRVDLIRRLAEPRAYDIAIIGGGATGRGGALHAAPVEPIEGFKRFMAAYPGAWVFTSATLAAGEDFRHFTATLGLEDAATLRLDSPFDYTEQARLHVPRGLPEPNDPGYSDAVAEVLMPLIEASGGGAFAYVGAGAGVAWNHAEINSPITAPIPVPTGDNVSAAGALMAGVGYDMGSWVADVGYRGLYIAEINNSPTDEATSSYYETHNNWIHEVRGTIRYRLD